MKDLYIITCATCYKPYNYRVYNVGELLFEQKEKPIGDYTEKTSHGICSICLPIELKKHMIDISKLED